MGSAQRHRHRARGGVMTMHRISRRRAVFVAVAALGASCATDACADSATYHGLGFSVQLPEGIVVKESEMVDFDVYEFSRAADGQALLGAYVGNAPWFGKSVPGDADQGAKRINGLQVTDYRWTDSAGRYHVELLIELAPKMVLRFPMYVHYWYHDLAGPEAALADEIIESTVGRPQ
jgi:hypothetical protein